MSTKDRELIQSFSFGRHFGVIGGGISLKKTFYFASEHDARFYATQSDGGTSRSNALSDEAETKAHMDLQANT